MFEDFNLLISTSRRNERNACSEAWYLLSDIGDKDAKVSLTNILGLVVAKTSLNPVEAVAKLRLLLKQKPWKFRYVLKVVPVEKIFSTGLEGVKEASMELASRIGEAESFRVTVEKRHTDLSTKDLIEAVASQVQRKVDLKNPDRIVLVEVVGELTGISLLKPEDILSVEREKRSI